MRIDLWADRNGLRLPELMQDIKGGLVDLDEHGGIAFTARNAAYLRSFQTGKRGRPRKQKQGVYHE